MSASITEILKILPMYIAHGTPSEDTLKSYRAGINDFLNWCSGNAYSVFDIDEEDAILYMRYLYEKGYSASSVALKIASVRMFYHVAQKKKAISTNPFEDVKTKSAVKNDAEFVYYNSDEIAEMFNKLSAESDNYIKFRDLALLMLMAVEGLRSVEIYRMNDEDINFNSGVIYIRGKGHDDYIFPCADTMNILEKYLSVRPPVIQDGEFTPTFISVSRCSNEQQRISRNGLHWIVKQMLIKVGKKIKGVSGHSLRHSCGTNLYRETKDLRLVQETLRHRNPTITARYAHVDDRIKNRKTAAISPVGRFL